MKKSLYIDQEKKVLGSTCKVITAKQDNLLLADKLEVSEQYSRHICLGIYGVPKKKENENGEEVLEDEYENPPSLLK